jgi:cytochrome c oxidase subunit 1
MTIALPAGIQIFCWIATMWDGRPRFDAPMLFVVGFIVTFVLGGLSGVMLASAPLDTQVHDTYFVVAHLHYVLIGGAVFPLLGGILYWFPKATGRMPGATAGKWAFWLIFLGFHATFFPMHLLGLWGMPRRVYTYPADMGWSGLNLASTLGAYLLATGVFVYFANLIISAARGRPAGPDPWGGGGLEWATASPPPAYNFALTPIVKTRHPLWTAAPGPPWIGGLSLDEREVLLTTATDARPDVRHGSPRASVWPLLTAVATTALFIGSIFEPWLIVWFALPFTLAVVGWFWPKTAHSKRVKPSEASPPGSLA